MKNVSLNFSLLLCEALNFSLAKTFAGEYTLNSFQILEIKASFEQVKLFHIIVQLKLKG